MILVFLWSDLCDIVVSKKYNQCGQLLNTGQNDLLTKLNIFNYNDISEIKKKSGVAGST